MLVISAPPRTYLVCAPPVLIPDWRHWLLIKVVCKFGTISQILLHLRVMPVEGVLYYYNIGVVVNRHHHCFMIKVAATTYLFIILFSMTTHHKQC